MANVADRLVWIDCEMTGLDPATDQIVEIACVVTDAELVELDAGISVVVRATLVQVLTPDAMRGRVSAVNSVFIGTSNELGGFESGLAARLFGPVAAVVGGGICTILVVFGVAAAWPGVARLGSLAEAVPAGDPDEVGAAEGA